MISHPGLTDIITLSNRMATELAGKDRNSVSIRPVGSYNTCLVEYYNCKVYANFIQDSNLLDSFSLDRHMWFAATYGYASRSPACDAN